MRVVPGAKPIVFGGRRRRFPVKRAQQSSRRATLDMSDLPQPAILLDDTGRVQDLNQAAMGFLGIAAVPRGQPAEELAPGLDEALAAPGGPDGPPLLRVAQKGGPARSVEVVARQRPDGTQLVVLHDATARHREMERLRRGERLMVDTQGVAHMGTWEWDLSQPTAVWSEELYRIYGLDPGSHVPTYEDYLTRVHPDDRQRVIDVTNGVLQDHRPYSHDERVYRPNGELRWLHTWAEPVLDDNGELVRLIGVCQDITDRKLADEEVRARLAEKDVLLREIHHRVKNNLQVIASLLNLQRRQLTDEAARESLEDSRQRVRSMALVHENLYRSHDLSKLDFGVYLRQLMRDLLRSYGASAIDLDIAVAEGPLDVDTAVSAGLLVNELAANALRHAFPDGKGALRIELSHVEGGRRLIVSDDGVGLPQDFDPESSKGLGLHLVLSLADQLGTRLAWGKSALGGAEFTVSLPDAEPAAPEAT